MRPDMGNNEEVMHKEMEGLIDTVKGVLNGLYGKRAIDVGRVRPSNGLVLQADFTFSILFVGSVFGEFILSLPKKTALHISGEALGENISDADLRDAFCEALNMVAGARLKSLAQSFPKLTISSPKANSGEIRYPSVKALQADLAVDGFPLTVSFYLDYMRLDIAESYKDSLGQLQKANQELLAANERLKLQQMQLVHSEKMASLGTMAAGVAHEINNPLSFVVSNSEALASYMSAFQELFGAYQRLLDYISEKKSKEAKIELNKVKAMQEEKDIPFIIQDTMNLMAESRSGLDRIRGIVNGLKLFSRVDDSGTRSVQINDELKNTLQLIASELKYRCEVSFSPGDIPKVDCVPGELGQVFVNLFVNASHAMPAEGGRLRVVTSTEGEFVKIQVADNGSGIAPENLSKIFDPFFTTKPVGQGTGLGLAITHSIVQNHGGSIQVESEPGMGTTFTLLLPVKKPAKVLEESSTPAA